MSDVSRETLQRYVTLLLLENERQNLISRATVADVWDRHIEDSLQLLDLAPNAKEWLDIGSGAGLPGIVLAIASGRPVTLVEPRARRVEFLRHMVDGLSLGLVTVEPTKLEKMLPRPYDAITARAVASLDALFGMALPFTHSETIWVLPKGRSAQSELESARGQWQGCFDIVPSRTDPQAGIVLARNVRRRGG